MIVTTYNFILGEKKRIFFLFDNGRILIFILALICYSFDT